MSEDDSTEEAAEEVVEEEEIEPTIEEKLAEAIARAEKAEAEITYKEADIINIRKRNITDRAELMKFAVSTSLGVYCQFLTVWKRHWKVQKRGRSQMVFA